MPQEKLEKAIGILGGTFDPIHFGHLRTAVEVCEGLELSKFYLLPNFIAPHKEQSHANAKDRVEMLKLSTEHQPRLELDLCELHRDKPSYTIDTLIELRQNLPNTPICFVIGLDSLLNLNKWHRWSELLTYCHFVISLRPGYLLELVPEIQELLKKVETKNVKDLHQLKAGKIYFQTTTQLDISSSDIRSKLVTGKSIDFLLPANVQKYIKDHMLYQKHI